MFHPPSDTYGTALQNWKSGHSRLNNAIQGYVDNCATIQTALAILPQLPSAHHLRNQAFAELGTYLSGLPAYEASLKESRLSLNKLHNTPHALVPINSLPCEILDLIFSFATKKSPDNARPACPARISSVCRLWRQKALGRPSLWARLYLTLEDPLCDFYHQRAVLWADRSGNFPLSVVVEAIEEDEDRNADLADKLSRIVKFLTPLMRRVYALRLDSGDRSKDFLHSLVNCWVRNGTIGTAKILKLSREDEWDTLVVPGTPATTLGSAISLDEFANFFRSLENLSLLNVATPRSYGVYSGLVKLHIGFMTSRHLRPTQSEFFELLMASPGLRTLIMIEFDIREEPGLVPESVVLKDLEILVLYTSDRKSLLLAYPLIAGGSVALSIGLTLFPDPEFSSRTQSFLTRLKATSLIVDGYMSTAWAQGISAVLAPLPDLKVLAIQGCDLSKLPLQDLVQKCLANNQSSNFWPAMRHLHIINCIVEQEDIRHLLSLHTPQNLYLHFRKGHIWGRWVREEERQEVEKAVSQTGVRVVWVPQWNYPESWTFVDYLLEQASSR